MLRLALLASGGGSNLQALLDAAEDGRLPGVEPVLVVADRECGAITRAMDAGVDAVLLDRRIHGRGLSAAVGAALEDYAVDFAALAGWLSILDESLVAAWRERILNIHPSLLPAHGGPGMYGLRVHQAVLAAGDAESGCSVHVVTAGVDEGRVLEQARVPVLAGDTPESLAARVLVEEHRLYPEAIRRFGASLAAARAGDG